MSDQSQTQLWEKRIQEWRTSGQTAAEWCRKHNYPYKVFLHRKFRYEHKMLKSVSQKTVGAPSFIELADSASNGIELRINGVTVYLRKGFNPELLKATLQILRSM